MAVPLDGFMNRDINNVFLRFTRRAETEALDRLVQTFVDTGSLVTLLESKDHSIVYGRRGTGKTHAFAFLRDRIASRGDIAVYVDVRRLGSTGGLYSDPKI